LTRQNCNAADTTWTNGRCYVSEQYGEGLEWEGVAVNDTIRIGDLSVSSIFVYMVSASAPLVNAYSEGILGLAYPDPMWPQSPVSDIASSMEQPNSFYLGFNRNGNGVLTIGQPDSRFYIGTFQTIPLYPNEDSTYQYYIVKPLQMTLGNDVIDFEPITTIVDSGTSMILLPPAMWQSVSAAFSSHSDLECLDFFLAGFACQLTASNLINYPDIKLAFAGGVTVTLAPQDYLQSIPGSDGYYQLGLGDSQAEDMAILGEPFFSSRYTGFDRENNVMKIATSSGNLVTDI